MEEVKVLRKSCGQFSPGTRVNVLTQPGKTREFLIVEATYTHVETYTDYSGTRAHKREPRTLKFEVKESDLVLLRSASELVPAVARINRPDRRAKREVYRLRNVYINKGGEVVA